MSHAANLRHRQSLTATAPSKRRKLSDSELPNGLNGLINGDLTSHKLHATPTQDLKQARRKQGNESEAAVRQGQADAEMHDAISIASSSDGEDDAADEEDDDDDDDDELDDSLTQANGHTSSSSQAQVGAHEKFAVDQDDSGDDAEPSFGDLLRSRGDQEPIDVSHALGADSHMNTTSLSNHQRSSAGPLTIPTATSLSTVLTQSLRTNDTALLESCLQVPHLDSIRSTIERLSPALASSLLQRLAERMHKRPGRAGPLMVWVQWTVVAHGGYLASQPQAMKHLHTLYSVVKQRATGLQPLLQLKGKLDMLEAQMQLRRNMQAKRRAGAAPNQGVIYVEADEDARSNVKAAAAISVSGSDESDDEMPQTLGNGVLDEDDDEEEEDEDSDDEDQDILIDDEAEESSAEESDAGLSDEPELDDDDDEEDDEDEDEDVEEIPAVRRSKAGRRR